MRSYSAIAAITLFVGSALAGPAATITEITAPDLPLPQAAYFGGNTLRLNLGIGSGAFRDPSDPPGVIWTITDRGPNLDCAGIDEITGLDITKLCAGDTSAKNFPLPEFAVTITKLQIDANGGARLLQSIPLKDKTGKPVSGLPSASGLLKLEAAYGIDGKPLPGDPSGLDTEAIVRLADGTFVIAEEYGSSILEVSADGTIQRRHVPAGLEKEFAVEGFEVTGSLPAIIAKRMLNRGIENLAVSPDGAFLYVMMQSPLANPGKDAYKSSANTRLWKIERATGKTLAQFAYVLDDAGTFKSDNKKELQEQNAVRLSEMVAVGADRLLVLERISKTSKFYLVDLSSGSPLAEKYDDATASPSFEMMSAGELEGKGVKPLAKSLLLDSDDAGGLPKKIEAIAVMSPAEMIVINDSDFGIEGDTTQIRRITFAEPVLK